MVKSAVLKDNFEATRLREHTAATVAGPSVGWFVLLQAGVGSLSGASSRFGDVLYFSAVVYSTLGFGDLMPLGPVRLLAGIESLTGLVLITWTASFTYLEMRAYWCGQNGT